MTIIDGFSNRASSFFFFFLIATRHRVLGKFNDPYTGLAGRRSSKLYSPGRAIDQCTTLRTKYVLYTRSSGCFSHSPPHPPNADVCSRPYDDHTTGFKFRKMFLSPDWTGPNTDGRRFRNLFVPFPSYPLPQPYTVAAVECVRTVRRPMAFFVPVTLTVGSYGRSLWITAPLHPPSPLTPKTRANLWAAGRVLFSRPSSRPRSPSVLQPSRGKS